MQITDKLMKPLTEVKYLNADNVSRYRCIMRIFLIITKSSVIGYIRRMCLKSKKKIRILRITGWSNARRIWRC